MSKKQTSAFNSFAARYGTAVLLVFGAFFITLSIWAFVEPLASPLFLAAIVITSWRGGLGPGVLATFLSGIVIDFFFIAPEFQWIGADIVETRRLIIFVIEGFVLCWFVAARTKAAEEIQNSREQLLALSLHQQNLREEERKQIALEIHDELGQLLTGLKMELHLLSRQLKDDGEKAKPDSTDEKIKDLLQLTDKTIQTVRRIATELRPAVLDDLGLVAAVEWQVKEFERRTGIPCRFSSNTENIEIDGQFSISVFRILQESLTNIMRHSGANFVKVDLKKTDNELVLRVEDDGKGIELETASSGSSLGIFGMRERARLIGGKLQIFKGEEKGTTVLLRGSLP